MTVSYAVSGRAGLAKVLRELAQDVEHGRLRALSIQWPQGGELIRVSCVYYEPAPVDVEPEDPAG